MRKKKILDILHKNVKNLELSMLIAERAKENIKMMFEEIILKTTFEIKEITATRQDGRDEISLIVKEPVLSDEFSIDKDFGYTRDYLKDICIHKINISLKCDPSIKIQILYQHYFDELIGFIGDAEDGIKYKFGFDPNFHKVGGITKVTLTLRGQYEYEHVLKYKFTEAELKKVLPSGEYYVDVNYRESFRYNSNVTVKSLKGLNRLPEFKNLLEKFGRIDFEDEFLIIKNISENVKIRDLDVKCIAPCGESINIGTIYKVKVTQYAIEVRYKAEGSTDISTIGTFLYCQPPPNLDIAQHLHID